MDNFKNTSFVVVDVETTGSDPKKNRIFDISCIRIENRNIVDVFNSLVNPHQFIPPYISKMTGVSNREVYFAPEPAEVFRKVFEFINIKPSIFVAHNANFDFTFLKNSLQRLGLKIDLPQLCTLKLARKLLPREIKKNVGSLSEYFQHKINNRHRAFDDSLATGKILNELLSLATLDYDITSIEDLLEFQNKSLKLTKVKSPNSDEILNKLQYVPNRPGIFKILDKNGNIIFSSRTNFLQNHLSSYFAYGEHHSKKIVYVIKNTYDIEWEIDEIEISGVNLLNSQISQIML